MIELLYSMAASGPTLTTAASAAAQDLVPQVLIPGGMPRSGGMVRARLMGKTSTVITTPGTATFAVFVGAARWGPSHIYRIGDRITSDANKTYTCVGPFPWHANTAYTVAGVPNMVSSHGKTYVCSAAGTSALHGPGPTGTGAGEVDGTGTLRWDYVAGAPGLSDPATPPAGAADCNDLCCQWDYTAAAAPFATSEAMDLKDDAAATDVPWLLQLDMIIKGVTVLVMGSYQAYNLEKIITPWGVPRLIPAATPAAVAFNPEIDNYLRIVYTPSVDTASITCMMYSVEGMAPMSMYGW